ncbi:MAG: hypothetical protein M1834_000013 [Cirrosporium novae-zelandiae]|nr:MAG: hypothetical protein M1834_000013 [Cirrosporium novae-zelandiae]
MSLLFEVDLEPLGDEGAEFCLKNEPGQLQRSSVVERGNALVVQCKLAEVVHGLLCPDSNIPCTLAIFEFNFQPTRLKRRFTEVNISIVFATTDPNRAHFDPEVRSIAPFGHFSLYPTTEKVELKRSANLSVEGGIGVQVGAGFGWELTNSMDKMDTTKVSGMIRFRNHKEGGKKNAAEWTLLENSSRRSGVPTFLRTAVLLGRREDDMELFTATVKIDANVDLLSAFGDTIQKMFGKIPRDDPIVFSPLEPPTTHEIDMRNLGEVDLQRLSVISSTA